MKDELRTTRRIAWFVIFVAIGWMLISMKLVARVGELVTDNGKLREACGVTAPGVQER